MTLTLGTVLSLTTLLVTALIGVIWQMTRRDVEEIKTAQKDTASGLRAVSDSVQDMRVEVTGLNGQLRNYTAREIAGLKDETRDRIEKASKEHSQAIKEAIDEQVRLCRDREDDISGVHPAPDFSR